MEIKQFEKLESKIIALVACLKAEKQEKASLLLKTKGLEEDLTSVALKHKTDTEFLKKANSDLRKEVERLNMERDLVRGKSEILLGKLEKIEGKLL